jgi:hypothetical protein
MKNITFYIFVFGVFALLGCDGDRQTNKTILPQSLGALGEVIVLSDEVTLSQGMREAVNDLFNKPPWGLPLSEPSYRVVYSQINGFKGYFKTHKNIVVLVHKQNVDLLNNVTNPLNINNFKQYIDSGAVSITEKNVWAQNQTVHFVLGKNRKNLIEKIEKGANNLLSRVEEHENVNARFKLIGTKEHKDSINKRLIKDRSFGIRVPTTYRIAMNQPDFMWLRKTTKKYDYGIFIYEEPYTNENQLNLDYIKQLRNSKTKQFIPGELENSYMSIEKQIPVQSIETQLNGYKAIKCGGWWNVVNDFMGGPFISYTVLDDKNNRVITLEGNLYGPNEVKLPALKELEVILNTLKIK